MTRKSPVDHRFPKTERLRRRKDFQRVFEEGRRLRHPLLLLALVRTNGGRRIGFSVPRRLGPAVVRNRLKRRLREIYRTTRPRLVEGYDIVLVARNGAETASYAELQSATHHLFRRARLFRAHIDGPDSP